MVSETVVRLDLDTPIGFVGAGRLGASLAAALHGAGYRVAAVSSSSASSCEAFAERVPGCAPVEGPQDVADIADAVFITTPDADVSLVAQSIIWRTGQAAIHCSGVLPLADLATASDSGALAGGL
ncbi:MAG: NAD(P)-binding domain-containing protein, partial [Chloroflexi bacterium]|nr:NAD(P)-binding domain-containing protein [Chloroflexota bacterium]